MNNEDTTSHGIKSDRARKRMKRKITSLSEDRIQELRTMPYNDYLQTAEWAERRKKALMRASYCCQVCNGNSNLHVHHRTYERRGNERDSDLTVLCKYCHERHHNIKQDESDSSQDDLLSTIPALLKMATSGTYPERKYVLGLNNGIILHFDEVWLMKCGSQAWAGLKRVYMWNFPGQEHPVRIIGFEVRVSEIAWVAVAPEGTTL